MHNRFAIPVVIGFLLAGICAPDTGRTQEIRTDSIDDALNQLPDDSTRIAKCLEMARSGKSAISGIYIAEGKRIARRSKDHRALAELLSEEAIRLNIQGKHVEGALLFLDVDSIYATMNDTLLRAGARTNAGLSYYHAGQYDSALVQYFQAYRIYEDHGPSHGYSRLLNNLAMCYKRTDKPTEAKQYYLKSISIKKQLGDSIGIANTLHNVALLLSSMGDVDEAVYAFDSAIAIYRLLDMYDDEASSDVALGKILMDANQFERAQNYLQSGYRYFRETAPGSREFMLAAGEMATLSARAGRWELADGYINEALTLTEHADRLDERGNLLELKAEISDQLGRGHDAYLSLKEVITLRDSMHSAQRMSLTEEMQTRFSVSEKEKDLRIAQVGFESQRRLSRLYRIGLFATLTVAVVIALLGLFLYRSRQEIKRKQKVIEQALHEKESLLKEIHHRVKNNLQIISSLLGMQSYQSGDPNVSDAMREGQNRVRSMALIHQSLYQNQDGIEVDAREYVESLINSLKSAYRVDPQRIKFDTEVEAIRLDVDMMIPMGLILNELATNALKYAFPDSRAGTISITLKALQDSFELIVKDNGIGIVRPQRLEQSQSMGFMLVSDFCTKLRAQLHVKTENGTYVEIRIPSTSLAA